eukprot:554518_1
MSVMEGLIFFLILLNFYQTSAVSDECRVECPSDQIYWFIDDKPSLPYNGCGVDHFSIKSDIYRSCCMDHDACWKICGVSAGFCNNRLAQCFHTQCEKQLFAGSELCKIQKTIVNEIVEISCNFYRGNQNKMCKCYSKTQLIPKLKKNIKYFSEKIGKKKNKKQISKYVKYLLGRQKNSQSKILGHSRMIDWVLGLIEKHPNKLIHYNGKSTWDTVKKKWNTFKTQVIEGGKKGWEKIKKGIGSLFSAHIDHDNEYTMQQKTDNYGIPVEYMVINVVMLLVFIILCGIIGFIAGFVVAAQAKIGKLFTVSDLEIQSVV